jgi:hypothetical protein
MIQENSRNPRPGKIAFWLLIELMIYSAFVAAYVLIVLFFLRVGLQKIGGRRLGPSCLQL